MTTSAEPSTPSGSAAASTTKATDHELQKYDIFTRYGQIGKRRLSGGEIGLGEGELCLVIGRVDDSDEVALSHPLEIMDGNLRDVARDARRERRDVSGDESVIGRFEPGSASPTIPMTGHIPKQPS